MATDPVDVLLVSLGSTHGWRVADLALGESLTRAGARVEIVEAQRPPEVRTLALTDLVWARAARRTARLGVQEFSPRSILYSTSTAALLWPRVGAVRYDDLAVSNRPGRHGVWQRSVERRRLASSPLLVPMSRVSPVPDGAVAVVVPPPVSSSGGAGERDIAAITYASDPVKKGLARVLEAWASARREGEELVVVTEHDIGTHAGVRVENVRGEAFRALVRRSRVYVVAPRREDFGIAQLEALADGCMLVTTDAPGPYEARELARALDPRLVGDDLAGALRAALDDPAPGYAERAAGMLSAYSPASVDRVVATELLPRLLGDQPRT